MIINHIVTTISKKTKAILKQLQQNNNSRNRKKETGSPIDLRVNLEDYNRCVAHLNAWIYDRLYS